MDTITCQSCGMPITSVAQHGTNADGSLNEEYCVYCFRGGDFLRDLEMDQLIDINLQYLQDYNSHYGTHYTKKEARECLTRSLPKLKRWRGGV